MNAQALRLIVIGCGRVFQRYHLPAIDATPDVQVVGACEIDAARRAWAREALPAAAHATITELALRAGLAVLVEKPMAVTIEEARRVCELQQRTGGVLRVGFNCRYRSDYARLRERAWDGVQSGSARRARPTSPAGPSTSSGRTGDARSLIGRARRSGAFFVVWIMFLGLGTLVLAVLIEIPADRRLPW